MTQQQQAKAVKLADVLDSVKRFLLYLVHHIKWFLLLTVATVLLAVGYYFFQKPQYGGTITFILEEKSGGMSGGGLSGIASQFGIDIGSLSGSSGMFAGDNILDILESRTIMEKALLAKVDTSKGEGGLTLADLYLEFSGLKSKWQGKSPELSSISFVGLKPGASHSLVQDSVLFIIYDNVTKKNVSTEHLNKKGSIIRVTTTSANPVFSKLLTELLLQETKKLYVDVKTSVTAANVQRLQHRADSLLGIINAKSYQSASAQLLDANSAFKTAAVPSEALQRDKMVTYAIYTEVMKNLEASRMAVANQTPVIQVLDFPKYPLENRKKPLFLLLLMGIAAGIVISMIIAFLSYPSDTDKKPG